MYGVLAIVLYSLTLQPASVDGAHFRAPSAFVRTADTDAAAMLFRWHLGVAISRGTDDDDERRVLVRLAWLEGAFSRLAATCQVRGDRGRSFGLFQIQPRSPEERAMACGTLDAQVALALRYVRRSRQECSSFAPRDQLSMYATGRCMNNRESRNRWGEPPFVQLAQPANDNGGALPFASGF